LNTKVSGFAAISTSAPGRPHLYVVRDPEPNLRPFDHKPWCTNHAGGGEGDFDPTSQFCRTASIELDFGDRHPTDYGFEDAKLTLEQYLNLDPDEPEKTYPTQVWVNMDSHDIGFEVDQAEAFAYALLALVALNRGETTAHDVLADKARETTVTRPAQTLRIGA
jgi:hypothetical protein